MALVASGLQKQLIEEREKNVTLGAELQRAAQVHRVVLGELNELKKNYQVVGETVRAITSLVAAARK